MGWGLAVRLTIGEYPLPQRRLEHAEALLIDDRQAKCLNSNPAGMGMRPDESTVAGGDDYQFRRRLP